MTTSPPKSEIFFSSLFVTQVFGWDVRKTVELNDVVCSQNFAEENGGCFYGAGRGVVNTGTAMLGNLADQGGCVCESSAISRQPSVISRQS